MIIINAMHTEATLNHCGNERCEEMLFFTWRDAVFAHVEASTGKLILRVSYCRITVVPCEDQGIPVIKCVVNSPVLITHIN